MPVPDTAILLLNLGGPVNLAQVEPFLVQLFSDRDLIKLPVPAFVQPLLARLIARLRTKGAQARYAEIGGGSPLLRESAAQAAALRGALRAAGRLEPVKLVFRTTQPRAEAMLRVLRGRGIRRLLPVSLYPHDCLATTGSSLRELQALAPGFGMELLAGVRAYATDPDYLEAVAAPIRAALADLPGATVLFSAHSLPRKQIDAGDPYEREIHATVDALKARLGDRPGGYRLAYQSRVGPIRWLEPSLGETLRALAGREAIVVPISFVSEHIETLHELDLEYAELARACGVRAYRRVPAPGTHPDFIRCLVRRTLAALGGPGAAIVPPGTPSGS